MEIVIAPSVKLLRARRSPIGTASRRAARRRAPRMRANPPWGSQSYVRGTRSGWLRRREHDGLDQSHAEGPVPRIRPDQVPRRDKSPPSRAREFGRSKASASELLREAASIGLETFWERYQLGAPPALEGPEERLLTAGTSPDPYAERSRPVDSLLNSSRLRREITGQASSLKINPLGLDLDPGGRREMELLEQYGVRRKDRPRSLHPERSPQHSRGSARSWEAPVPVEPAEEDVVDVAPLKVQNVTDESPTGPVGAGQTENRSYFTDVRSATIVSTPVEEPPQLQQDASPADEAADPASAESSLENAEEPVVLIHEEADGRVDGVVAEEATAAPAVIGHAADASPAEVSLNDSGITVDALLRFCSIASVLGPRGGGRGAAGSPTELTTQPVRTEPLPSAPSNGLSESQKRRHPRLSGVDDLMLSAAMTADGNGAARARSPRPAREAGSPRVPERKRTGMSNLRYSGIYPLQRQRKATLPKESLTLERTSPSALPLGLELAKKSFSSKRMGELMAMDPNAKTAYPGSIVALCQFIQPWADATGHKIVARNVGDNGSSLELVLNIQDGASKPGHLVRRAATEQQQRQEDILESIRRASMRNRQAMRPYDDSDIYEMKYLDDVKSVLGLLAGGSHARIAAPEPSALPDGKSPTLPAGDKDAVGIVASDETHEIRWIESKLLGVEATSEDVLLPDVLLDYERSLLVGVRFSINYRCEFGDELRLVGSADELGAWDESRGLRMNWSENDLWTITVDLPFGLVTEYKYVVVDRDGGRRWQDGNNRVLCINERPVDGLLDAVDVWDGSPLASFVTNTDVGGRSGSQERLNDRLEVEKEIQLTALKIGWIAGVLFGAPRL